MIDRREGGGESFISARDEAYMQMQMQNAKCREPPRVVRSEQDEEDPEGCICMCVEIGT